MGEGEHDDEPLDDGPEHGGRERRGHEHDDPEHDDPEEDEPTAGAPPDPLDRVWVHPTELPNLPPGVAPRASKSRRSVARRSRRLTVPLVAGATGAIATLAVLGLSGSLDDTSTANKQSVSPLSTPVGGANAEQLANRIGLSVVAVAARDGRGARFGSGVCVRHAGEVLTTSRLVGNAKTVDILTSDGERHTARVIGRDRTTDLVLLSVGADANLPAAQLAEHTPKVGTSVWIMGSTPAGSSTAWISAGLLSSADAVYVAPPSGPMTGGLLETDAATGAAATGGALVDENGDVTGIVLGRLDDNGTTYAVPISTAVDIAEALHTDGVAKHGSAGLTVVDGPTGPTIMAMAAQGPAARGGLRVGDVVSSVDGRAVESKLDVMGIVRNDAPGRVVTFVVLRGNDEIKLRVELAAITG